MLPKRLEEKIEYEPNSGCWLWTGRIRRDRYGQAWDEGKHGLVHRIVYKYIIGPPPADLGLDHLCRVRSCVNPAHLEPVPGWINTLRGDSPSAINARRTCCSLCGGPYTTEKNGTRSCRPCHAAWLRQRRAVRSPS